MFSRSETKRALSHDDGLEIRLYHALDSNRRRNLRQFIQVEPLSPPRIRKRFKRDVQTDLVPEPEAVRDRAREAVDANGLPVNAMLVNANVEHGRRDVDDSERRRRKTRHACTARNDRSRCTGIRMNASRPRWAVEVIRTTTPSRSPALACSRPRSFTHAARGERGRRSDSRRSSGWIGSTPVACWSRLAMCHRSSPKRGTTSRPRWPDSHHSLSGKPGTVHPPGVSAGMGVMVGVVLPVESRRSSMRVGLAGVPSGVRLSHECERARDPASLTRCRSSASGCRCTRLPSTKPTFNEYASESCRSEMHLVHAQTTR